MKKKLVALMMVAAMAVSLTACGSGSSDSAAPAADAAEEAEEEAAEEPAEEEAEAEAEAETEAAEEEADAPAGEAGAFDEYERPVVVSDDEMSIIYLISNMTDESNVRPENQVEVECAHRGWDFQCINYETEDNFRQYMDNAISQQPTAIIIGITQSFPSFQDLVEKARNAGIGVYSLDNAIIPGVISNATLDGAQAATELMDKVSEDHPNSNYTFFELAMAEVITVRANAVKAYDGTNGMHCLGSLDIASTGDLANGGYQLTQTWLEQYGDDLDCIICNADPPAMSAAEAIIQAGDPHGEKTFCTGVDGGSATWAYMRQDTPLKYTYSQPFELFAHNTCEIISDIQVKGLNPGDEGCTISEVGETFTAPGIVTTMENVPEPGDSIHSVFDFYGEDPEDADAWYSWNDGPGIYQVTE